MKVTPGTLLKAVLDRKKVSKLRSFDTYRQKCPFSRLERLEGHLGGHMYFCAAKKAIVKTSEF